LDFDRIDLEVTFLANQCLNYHKANELDQIWPQIKIPYNFKEIVKSQITEFKPFLGIKTLRKCHILKRWHDIEGTSNNFPPKWLFFIFVKTLLF
jgi:hypothetical protein